MRLEVVATPDPPPKGVPNPIHTAEGGTGAGYRGALVAGVRTYGWVVELVVGVAGLRWLDDGWADVTLRRPLYAGELVTIDADAERSEPGAGGDTGDGAGGDTGDGAGAGATPGAWSVRATAGAEVRVVLDGRVGVGRAAFADLIDAPPWSPPLEPPALRRTYTIDEVPLRRPLRPLGVTLDERAGRRLALDELGQAETAVPPTAIHPWFLAARMAPLTRHNFTYGPTIHVRTQIQHLAAAPVGGRLVIGAQIVEAYERKEHWYQVLDGALWVDDPGRGGEPLEVARLRHTTIFRPRGTELPPPLAGATLPQG